MDGSCGNRKHQGSLLENPKQDNEVLKQHTDSIRVSKKKTLPRDQHVHFLTKLKYTELQSRFTENNNKKPVFVKAILSPPEVFQLRHSTQPVRRGAVFGEGHPNYQRRRRAGRRARLGRRPGEPLLLRAGRCRLLVEAPDGEVVDHLLHLLHVVLQAVVALPQGVVFEVEEAEAGVQLVDEGGDVQGPRVVPGGHAVDGQPRLRREAEVTAGLCPRGRPRHPHGTVRAAAWHHRLT